MITSRRGTSQRLSTSTAIIWPAPSEEDSLLSEGRFNRVRSCKNPIALGQLKREDLIYHRLGHLCYIVYSGCIKECFND